VVVHELETRSRGERVVRVEDQGVTAGGRLGPDVELGVGGHGFSFKGAPGEEVQCTPSN
jgi:hypothetical protein